MTPVVDLSNEFQNEQSNFHPRRAHLVDQRGGGGGVRNDRVNLCEGRERNQTDAAPLRVVQGGDDAAAHPDQRTLQLGLLDAHIRQPFGKAEAVRAEKAALDVELPQDVQPAADQRRRLPAQRAAQQHDVHARRVEQLLGDDQAVGDNREVTALLERLRDRQRGAAAVQEDGVTIGDHRRARDTDTLLLHDLLLPPRCQR